MDEISDCIADAQFGEVLRGRDNTSPNQKIPSPPAETWDPESFARKRNITFATTVQQPVGVYLLGTFSREGRHVYKFLYELHKFEKETEPDFRMYMQLLAYASKLPSKYRSVVEDVKLKLNASILPSLKSAASMRTLLAMEKGSKKTEKPNEALDIEATAVEEVEIEASVSEEGVEESEQSQQAEKEIARRRQSIKRQRAANKADALKIISSLKAQLHQDQAEVWKNYTRSDIYDRMLQVLWYTEQPISINGFNVFRDLGRGAFGVVSGAKLRTTGSLLALKGMNKKLVKGKNATKLVKAERDVLARLGENISPFAVYLQYSFCDKDNYYLALPLCTGGDLMYHLAIERFFSPDRVKFIMGEILLGLAHLHALGILYRDLKPDNILLDEEGHVKISDMGLAVIIGRNGKSLRGRAGTPGYWSPEMISKRRYSFPTDWWSFGCVMFELLTGRCPFSKLNTKMERDDATLKWTISCPSKLPSGSSFPDDARDIIMKLLDRNKTTRLGSSERGAEDIKEDPYFAQINFSKLQRKELKVPFVPRKEQIHAFNQSDIDNKANEHDYRKTKLDPSDEISGFEFISSVRHQEDVVEVLKMQDEGRLAHLDRPEGAGCCVLQ